MPVPQTPELLQGTLELLILATLRLGSLHGYGIARSIEARSAQALRIEEGSLYPALQRLARVGAIVGEWRSSPTGRRARAYRLTSAGHLRLERQLALWKSLSAAVDEVITL